MRARPREINIFNMSLLDILCGALGAFCFMMLVALPYYVVSRSDRAENQKRTEELMKDVEKLREKMSDPEQAEELRKLIDQLQAQIKQLQGELNQAEHENEQLKDENARLASENNLLTTENASLTSDNKRLTDENVELTADNVLLKDSNEKLQAENELNKERLVQKKPFVVLAHAMDMRQDVALYLEDMIFAGEKDKSKLANTKFEPDLIGGASSHWQGDQVIRVPDRATTMWVSSTSMANSSFRVFLKYYRPPPPPEQRNFPFGDRLMPRPTDVRLAFWGDFLEPDDQAERFLTLTPQRYWIFVGTLSIDDKDKLHFKEATEAERDDAWRAITKTEPPKVTPTPAPEMTPIPGLNKEEMDRLREMTKQRQKQIEEEKARREQQGASPAPNSTRGSDMAEKALREREQRAREAQSPAASPPATMNEQERARRERIMRELEKRGVPVPSPSVSP